MLEHDYDYGGPRMKKLSFVLSLTNNDNDYQLEQAASAEEAATRLGLDIEIIFALVI